MTSEKTENRKSIKTILIRRLMVLTVITVVLIAAVMIVVQFLSAQEKAMEDANDRFVQIHHLMEDNRADRIDMQDDLEQTYIRNAHTAAAILQERPELLEDPAELKDIAAVLEVDEISVFDETGKLYAGTNPEDYGMTFDSEEQLAYFKPMLDDKSLELCQDVTEDVYDGKVMRYAAVWSENGEFIVEVGKDPEVSVQVMKKYDLSYIFSLLRVDSEAELYAADSDTGEIMGSTIPEDIGGNLSDIGIDMDRIQTEEKGFHATIHGEIYYCVFASEGKVMLGRIIPDDEIYKSILPRTLEFAIMLLLVVTWLILAIIKHMDMLVIRNIQGINEKLLHITEGYLDERVKPGSSSEFYQLSMYINEMVESLADRMEQRERLFNIVAQHSNRILYSYDLASGTTRLWSDLGEGSDILAHIYAKEYTEEGLEYNEAILPDSVQDVKAFFAKIYDGEPSGEANVHIMMEDGRKRWYSFMYSAIYDGDKPVTALISVADVTEKYEMIQRAEYDAMTGLLRRGVGEQRIKEYLAGGQEENCILIILDLDDLKGINDELGHKTGDEAITGIARTMQEHFREDDILIRAGGDEFIAFMKDTGHEAESNGHFIGELLQKLSSVSIGENGERSIHCSAGCAVTSVGERSYDELFKQADLALYYIKRNDKNDFAFYVPEMEQANYEFRSKKLLSMQSISKYEMAEIQRLLDSFLKFCQLVISVDVSANTYHILEEIKDGVFASVPDFGTLDDFVAMSGSAVHPDDKDMFFEKLSRKALLEAYERGEDKVHCTFRFLVGGQENKVECMVAFYVNDKGDVCDFTMLRWVEQEL